MNAELLGQRHMEASINLVDLEAQRGAAVLDGKPFDTALIVAARSELEAISAAEAEATRRNRLAMASAEEQRCANVRKDIAEALPAYEDALTRAEASCKALVAALVDLQALTKRLHQCARSLGRTSPISFNPMETKTILSRLVVGELNALGSRSGFGVMEWTSVNPPNWTADLEKHVKPAMTKIMENE